MQKAIFSIIDYQFDKVIIDFDNFENSDETTVNFDTSGKFIAENSRYELKFGVNVIKSVKNSKPYVSVQCLGTFHFDNVSSLEEIPDFFYRNAIAILFPYLRAYISFATTQANIPGIILPTLNLSGLEEQLRISTSQV